jgi:hypothetical protein
MLIAREPDIHQEHKAQMAEAEEQVALASQLVHAVCNNRTVRLMLLEKIQDTIRRQRLFRAARIQEKTTST